MFQEKCVNLEQALESANTISADEIKALRRKVTMYEDQNRDLTTSYDSLKQEYESKLFEKDQKIDKITWE